MNSHKEDAPEVTRFDAPDVSDLFDRSTEIIQRSRVINNQANDATRRLHEVLAANATLQAKLWRMKSDNR